MCCISSAVSVLVYLFLTKSILSVLVIPIAIIGSIYLATVSPNFFYHGLRVEAWKNILDQVSGISIVFGKGIGFLHTQNIATNAAGHIFRQAHNEFISIYLYFGVIGIACFCLLASKIRVKDKAVFAVFISLIINSSCNITFHVAPLTLFAIICYSILEEENERKEIC